MLQAFRPYVNSYTLSEPSTTKKKIESFCEITEYNE